MFVYLLVCATLTYTWIYNVHIYCNSIRYESLFDFADIRTPLGFFYTFFPSVILCSNRTNCRFVLVSHSNTNAQIHLQLQTCSLIYHMYTSLYIHLYFELKVNESMSLWWFVALNAHSTENRKACDAKIFSPHFWRKLSYILSETPTHISFDYIMQATEMKL